MGREAHPLYLKGIAAMGNRPRRELDRDADMDDLTENFNDVASSRALRQTVRSAIWPT